ncbi:DNA polymerase V [Novimethylophilus kurashikiensis]|uniref:DNA polymerase V n=1 Tax=Novimethylophilus kurashikiensis TaxID=1825523 RepID=A0A2R5F831_9PROT|nr:Y-family DNA polymerase [Novimethylophilus kurashikiensis]GBG14402.1 DNA polymerase V [Novimethylophilus kurashikiensis]
MSESSALPPVFALVDANNFYASCETVFNPKLRGRPVIVLSNNDGCAIARSAEAKALGIKMGDPYFKIEKEFRKAGGVALSSNFALYADMSNRVMSLLSEFSARQEVYSIDECFLGMEGHRELTSIGLAIRSRILTATGLPVCVGFAPTKTLSKLANHVAKKQPDWNGVCDLTALSASDQDALVGGLDVAEVWGVGRRLASALHDMRITTVRQLRDANPKQIRSRFSVVLERTVLELRGISCLALEEVVPPRQQIVVSRSFGAPVYDLPDLEQAVGTFAARAAEKLRGQSLAAGAVRVFIHTSPFRTQEPQYGKSVTLPFHAACDDTLRITGASLAGLKHIYQPGYAFSKAGVMLDALIARDKVPVDLFEMVDGSKSQELMRVLDSVNSKFGKGSIATGAACGAPGAWTMRQSNKSPAYTTQWDELPKAR